VLINNSWGGACPDPTEAIYFRPMISAPLDHLNDKQRQAVTAPLCHLLVLAGAGSGKTSVLVHRMAWLIQDQGTSPLAMLAVTFTNKAANEMRTRMEGLLGHSVRGLWIGTFHGLAHRLLRLHYQDAQLPENFQILDSDDQYRLIKRMIKNQGLNEERFPPKQVQWFIQQQKEQGLRAKHLSASFNRHEAVMIELYQAYEEHCQAMGLVDFAELLLRSHELWLQHPSLLEHYQDRFHHILVDEFQDTNTIQYAWIRLLAGKAETKVMVVGDDDQSIYSWRGACVANLKHFETDFSNVMRIHLEQNYRSTATILQAANALIDNNPNRYKKTLWTQDEQGAPIKLYAAFNEIEEARFIAHSLKQWQQHGEALRHMAILYRSNAQSRILEEALLQAALPYRIYGGFRFFERSEIKDTLAYLRLCTNLDDDASFERIINHPPRGIGLKTVAHIRDHAKAQHLSLWDAARALCQSNDLSARAKTAITAFISFMEHMIQQLDPESFDHFTDLLLDDSGLRDHFRKEKGESGRARLENLNELVLACKQFIQEGQSNDDNISSSPLQAFLAHCALEAGEHQAKADEDCVKLMTFHAAKGLEFPCVIMAGMEEQLFPHQMCLDSPEQIEEERRLCYVGMTRTMKQLLLCYAESRRSYGQTQSYRTASRFISEIPKECIERINHNTRIQHTQTQTPQRKWQQQHDSGLSIGQSVRHASFGDGVVLQIEGQGAQSKVQVQFTSGAKWLMLDRAKLS
jgi:DNA helicase-2/ATP-dependent DNA helicase PcrA